MFLSSPMTTAAIIPCYKVKDHIMQVINSLPKESIDYIFVVDDKCPENSGQFVQSQTRDPRVQVLFHNENQGVGGAVITGYKAILENNIDIAIKIDGDGQMPTHLINSMLDPIKQGQADYTKGNRFFNIEGLLKMPKLRLIGNSLLSFISKMSSGYWNIMDPTNGFTAISKDALQLLPLNKISRRYFFESDMLFRLNTIRAVVKEIPHQAIYEDEVSNLKIHKIIFPFTYKYLSNFIKRIFYTYFLRDFNIGSIEIVAGLILTGWGVISGLNFWLTSIQTNVPATSGQVMLAALPLILGFQSILAAIQYDVSSTPTKPLTKRK
jgi:dolichol-phosphate mannosyltransferase